MNQQLFQLCKLVFFIVALWMSLLIFALTDHSYGKTSLTSDHCRTHAAFFEKANKIPTGLLQAISKIESGRKDEKGRIFSWPWTINAEGKGYFFPTKEKAIEAVLALKKKGVRLIDVGCAQINLYHHPKAFKTLEDAFDPETNLKYAAHFLLNLQKEHGSWHKAVAHYHSANPFFHIPYRTAVLNVWKKEAHSKGNVLAEALLRETLPSKVNRIRKVGVRTLPLHHASLTNLKETYRARKVATKKINRLKRIP